MSSPLLPDGMSVFERGWLSSNSILFVSDECTAIVDTGYATHAAQTLALVRGALGARPLDLIVNTHLHSDHCGGNAMLQLAFPGVRTLIPPGLADAVQVWDEQALTYSPTGQRCERFHFQDLACPGTELQLGSTQWQVHAAPGHDPHSIILFEPLSRALISADALWENGFGVVFPELEGVRAFDEVARTLDVIEALNPRTVIPGHGSTFDGARIGAALATARERLAGLAADPTRHAAHAAKVLIKFKLLEWQCIPVERFFAWAERVAYMRTVHSRFFRQLSMRSWLEELVVQLARSRALKRDNEALYNI